MLHDVASKHCAPALLQASCSELSPVGKFQLSEAHESEMTREHPETEGE